MSIASLIKEARNKKGYTQDELASIMQRPRTFVAKIEAGYTHPDYRMCLAFADALELPVDQVIATVEEEIVSSVLPVA